MRLAFDSSCVVEDRTEPARSFQIFSQKCSSYVRVYEELVVIVFQQQHVVSVGVRRHAMQLQLGMTLSVEL